MFGPPIKAGELEVRLARPEEIPQLFALRASAFRGDPQGQDSDTFDTQALHLWLGARGGAPLGTARLFVHETGDETGYAARFFDLRPLAALPGRAVELGRLCLTPERREGVLVRLLWAGVARIVLSLQAARIYGCVSFPGVEPLRHAAAFATLVQDHLGPEALRPKPVVAEAVSLSVFAKETCAPTTASHAALPMLLQAYVSLGAWVADQLVIDRELATCVVFTCLEIDAMPKARLNRLKALAQGL